MGSVILVLGNAQNEIFLKCVIHQNENQHTLDLNIIETRWITDACS